MLEIGDSHIRGGAERCQNVCFCFRKQGMAPKRHVWQKQKACGKPPTEKHSFWPQKRRLRKPAAEENCPFPEKFLFEKKKSNLGVSILFAYQHCPPLIRVVLAQILRFPKENTIPERSQRGLGGGSRITIFDVPHMTIFWHPWGLKQLYFKVLGGQKNHQKKW